MAKKTISSAEAIRNREIQCKKTWQKALIFFDTYFVNKTVVYEYRKQGHPKDICKVSVRFEKSNFLHLCGLQPEKNSKSSDFWKEIKNKRFNSDHWRLSDEIMGSGSDPKKYFFWKSAALMSIYELLSPKVCLTKGEVCEHLVFDMMVRSHKQTIGLALKQTGDCYKVISTINLSNQLSKRTIASQKIPITRVYSIDQNGNETVLCENPISFVNKATTKRHKKHKYF